MFSIESFSINTPALLFPTISLLLLAYTNRFLGITTVIRKLHEDLSLNPENHAFYLNQIKSLSQRIKLIVWAQKLGTLAIIACSLSMVLSFFSETFSIGLFAFALTTMTASLLFIFRELSISQEALTYILEDCEKFDKTKTEGKKDK